MKSKFIDPDVPPESFYVGVQGHSIVIMPPITRALSKVEALMLAARLVALADDPCEPQFGRLLREFLNT
jgi:hypothetical protein